VPVRVIGVTFLRAGGCFIELAL